MNTIGKGVGIIGLLLVLIVTGCDIGMTDLDTKNVGTLSLQVKQGGDFVEKTLLPSISMDIVEWSITGSGPDQRTYGPQTFALDASITIPDLYKGTWNITVEGLNASGDVIGRGSKSLVITAAQTTNGTITVVPLSGNGTLELSVSWPTSLFDNDEFEVTLTDKDGVAHVLSPTLDYSNGTGSYSGTWAAGYYDLNVQLLDGTTAVWGTYESVRVVEGQATEGTLILTEEMLNISNNGALNLDIVNDMQNPFLVSLSGVSNELTAGTSMQVSSSVDPSSETYSYVWFLNGVMIPDETLSTITFGDTLAIGHYNLALRVSDGTVISSTVHYFSVVPPLNVVIDPDYNFTPDETDSTPFTVVSVVPSDQAQNVPVGTSITVYFDDLINPISLNDVSMSVTVADQVVSGTFALERSTNDLFAVLHFTPSQPFMDNVDVTVTLSSVNGLLDKGGNTLENELVFTFHTAAAYVGDVTNLGFESGLTGWNITGNGGIVDLPFASVLSLEGVKAAMITTDSAVDYGLSGTPLNEATSMLSSGSLEVPGAATLCKFDYYFLSAEFIEFIGSQFDDTLTMTFSGPSGTIIETIETVNTYQISDCIPLTSNLDNDLYHTGAKTKQVDISGLGSPITISFAVSDVGDQAYISALLVDNFRFE
nr:Ig-like domain-containing protein [uncultured Sphaerochaeta sp.]